MTVAKNNARGTEPPMEAGSLPKSKRWSGTSSKSGRWSGWHFTILSAILACSISLFANLLLLAIGLLHYDPVLGRGNISTGSCDSTPALDTGLHVGINLLSAFLISSSNSAMQCLSAPSRVEVDANHANGRSVEIAVSGVKNLRFMPGLRRSLWVILLLTSIPLHLFYNAVIMTTMTAHSWNGLLVQDNFLQGEGWNRTVLDNAWTPLDGLATTLQQEAKDQSLQRMDSKECQETFNKNFLFNYQAVIFVATSNPYLLQNSSQPILGYMGSSDGLKTFTNLSNPDNPTTLTSDDSPDRGHFWTDLAAANSPLIDHCFAEAGEQLCTVDTIPAIQGIVVLLNFIKLACFVTILFYKREQPLITIGDAVASFLEYPDETTKEKAAEESVQRHPVTDLPAESSATNPSYRSRFWFRAPSKLQWLLTGTICVGYWIAGIVLFALYIRSQGPDWASSYQWLADGFQKFNMSLIPSGAGGDMQMIDLAATIRSVVVINSFQLLLSTAYFHFNGIMTTMLLSREFASFAQCRKGLRVSNPRGEQRLAYWLSIPYTYAVPVAIVSVALHFLLSEAFYYEEAIIIDRVDGTPHIFPRAVVSAEALFILLVVCAACILGLVALGFRRYATGMPLARCDSQAISAACQPRNGHPYEAYKKLMWGVRGFRDGKPDIGFSGGDVEPVCPVSTRLREPEQPTRSHDLPPQGRESPSEKESITGRFELASPNSAGSSHYSFTEEPPAVSESAWFSGNERALKRPGAA